MTSDNSETSEVPKSGWRVQLGTWMFTIPFLMFIGAPIVIPLLGMSTGQAAATIGAIIVAAEVIWFASIPLLGLQGFVSMKKKAFGFLRLKSGPISKSRHKLGTTLFVVGVGGQISLHVVMMLGYAVVGANPDRVILGMNFDQQLAVYFTLLIASVISAILGLYALGADFVESLRYAFRWQIEQCIEGETR